jgi:hypothetical protein
MGIVLGKPANYKKGVTASAVRRIANEEYRVLRNRNTKRNNRRKEPEPEEDPDEMPDEIKDAMREMGLDPTDPADIQDFMEKIQAGGTRSRRRRRR